MEVSGGRKEEGVVFGNSYNKYGSKNPIERLLMNCFDRTITGFVKNASPETIHEVGCGEGYWTIKWHEQKYIVKGTDFSQQVIDIARKNASSLGISEGIFHQRSIYDLQQENDSADLIVCCEVLEHLENPRSALEVLQTVVRNFLIISVPREPIWSMLNMARGKYLADLGNTPGHIQRWSRKNFIRLVSEYFEVISVKSPLPWTVAYCRAFRKKENN